MLQVGPDTWPRICIEMGLGCLRVCPPFVLHQSGSTVMCFSDFSLETENTALFVSPSLPILQPVTPPPARPEQSHFEKHWRAPDLLFKKRTNMDKENVYGGNFQVGTL